MEVEPHKEKYCYHPEGHRLVEDLVQIWREYLGFSGRNPGTISMVS